MNRVVEHELCNGCEVCIEKCPQKAIELQMDYEGFNYPYINEKLCINCGICGKICPVQNKVEFRTVKYNDTVVFGGYLNNHEQLLESSSGGFFRALSKEILEDGGIVYGVVYTKDLKKCVYKSSDEISTEEMSKSKYLTAEKKGIYYKIYKSLIDGKQVLFTGLPCEVVALYTYLGKEYKNLLTCELICAGPSSYKLYQDQIDWLTKKYGSGISEFQFRFKKYGWGPCVIRADLKNGKTYSEFYSRTIFGVGMKYAKRKACFNCPFKGERRLADFTVGDFWNPDKHSECYNEDGTSIIFTRTEKAVDYMKSIKGFRYISVKSESAINGNKQQLKYGLGIPEEREKYMDTLCKKGGYKAYCEFKPSIAISAHIKRFLPVKMYRLLRKIDLKMH